MTRISITAGATAGNKRRAATHYGVRDIENVLPTEYRRGRSERELEYVFNFDDLPTTGLDEAILRIPANARIKEAYLTVITAFAGGTSYNIGLSQPDGTVVDADGIDAGVLLAAIDAVGERVTCDGALVSSFSINAAGVGTEFPAYLQATVGANDVQVTLVATGTFTAGKARLNIVFELIEDRAVSQDT